jgi:hypothetical protein
MVSDIEVCMKHRCVIEFLTAEQIAPIDIHRQAKDYTIKVIFFHFTVHNFWIKDGSFDVYEETAVAYQENIPLMSLP